MRRKVWLGIGVSLTVAACSSPPTADVDLAKTSLEKATAAGAATYAPQAMKAAVDAKSALDAELRAQSGKWFKSYEKAEELAVAAQAAADKAAADAVGAREDLIAQAKAGQAATGPNLFRNGDFSDGLAGWERIPTPSVDVRVTRSGKDGLSELKIHVGDAAQHIVLLQGITLKPDTPYLYEMDVKSTGTIVALYWDSDVGRFDSEKSFPDETKLRYVFTTPHWNGQPRYANFHPLLTKGAGDISVKNVRLSELRVKGG